MEKHLTRLHWILGVVRIFGFGKLSEVSPKGRQAVWTLKLRLTLDNNVALLERFSHRWELRNVDKARMTSLSWAAVEGRTAVFEWLLLDHGHDDQELSRVSRAAALYQRRLRIENGLTDRTTKTTRSSISSLLYPVPRPPLHDTQSYRPSAKQGPRKRSRLSHSIWPTITWQYFPFSTIGPMQPARHPFI